MAQRVITTSDLSGADGATTLMFAMGGSAYEIDLTPTELKELEALLKPYTTKARHVGTKTARAGSKTAVPASTATVRAWATASGIKVSPKGRIPVHVIEAFEKANA
jgi:hypothetical protein